MPDESASLCHCISPEFHDMNGHMVVGSWHSPDPSPTLRVLQRRLALDVFPVTL